MEVRYFGKAKDAISIPNLVEIQTESYRGFLQAEVPPERRENVGLEAILRESFPVVSYVGDLRLEYVRYELGRPRYTQDECRRLHLTYGMPFKIRFRLVRDQVIEEDVYLGDMPIMMGGGEFIINGAERVIVMQLHRSPGIDFMEEAGVAERRLHACRIIPERGSWIEISVNRRDAVDVSIDQSGKFPATVLLRAASPKYSTNADLLRVFYETTVVDLTQPRAIGQIKGAHLVEDIVDKKTGEVVAESGTVITDEIARKVHGLGVEKLEVMAEMEDPLILNTVRDDGARSHDQALVRIYRRLRPGNPDSQERARQLFKERFFDPNRYRLGKVGRFRMNRKLGQSVAEDQEVLQPEDLVNAVKYLMKLRKNEGAVDDIDHLGNRRLRTLGELVSEEMRKGFLKLRRTVQERMSMKDQEQLTPRMVVNSKTIAATIDYFFGRSELAQVVDQHNPLAQLSHERRLSALGPGGLNRKRAGFVVRDVHASHYGRICPVETPEGQNIGLITYLALYAFVDRYGFLTTPYREVVGGKVTHRVRYLRADEESEAWVVPADALSDGSLPKGLLPARYEGDFRRVPADKVQYADVSTKQIVGVAAGLIPFLEHDDANRALMGSNMQKQAVPLLVPEPPIVATGMERAVAENSGMVVRARRAGTVTKVTSDMIEIEGEAYPLRKFAGLNEHTCLNQRPIVREGAKVQKGQIIADGAATRDGELALGRNVLCAFMVWDGYNFEDSIVVSERLVKEDLFTSVHIEEFEVEIRETKLGREEFTRDIPNVSEKALRNLDEEGIVRVGTKVGPGDILVGKVSPKSKSELSPEEKLLYAIFGRAGEDVKNDSLIVPAGTEGIVVDAQKFSRKAYLSEDKRQQADEELRQVERQLNSQIEKELKSCVEELEKELGRKLTDPETGSALVVHSGMTEKQLEALEEKLDIENILPRGGKRVRARTQEILDSHTDMMEQLKDERERTLDHIRRGDELPSGVLEMVKVYVATKRPLSVGDKMAGRHGNKGVIARVVPEEDMPFLEDGTPVDVIFNPLGVPSRMNVGQLLEANLGWAAKRLGFQAICPPFDGASEAEVRSCLVEAGLPEDGKVTLCDGRTGEPFGQKVTAGYMYILKLDHLVDDKVHARATGPYSLITQQPLGGKARAGGQRFGEMEAWALEAYGAAFTLQELWTVKSDDVEGRTRMYEAMVKGENTLEPGMPVAFDVLTNEIRGLGLKMELVRRKL